MLFAGLVALPLASHFLGRAAASLGLWQCYVVARVTSSGSFISFYSFAPPVFRIQTQTAFRMFNSIRCANKEAQTVTLAYPAWRTAIVSSRAVPLPRMLVFPSLFCAWTPQPNFDTPCSACIGDFAAQSYACPVRPTSLIIVLLRRSLLLPQSDSSYVPTLPSTALLPHSSPYSFPFTSSATFASSSFVTVCCGQPITRPASSVAPGLGITWKWTWSTTWGV